MSSLIQPAGGVPLSRGQRQTLRAMREERGRAAVAAVKIENARMHRQIAMESAVSLDDYRQLVAVNNPELNSVLARLEMGFVNDVEQIIRAHNNPLGI